MYTALVLHPAETQKLLATFGVYIPPGWSVKAHHMTINLGRAADGPAATLVGQPGEAVVRTVAVSDQVVAVGVESDVPSNNAIKHITLAVNELNGGKAKHSNGLTNWQPVPELKVAGIVDEVL